MIEWKDYNPYREDNTPLPDDIYLFLMILHQLGIIPDGPINAKFMNKYHPEVLFEEYKKGYGKNYEELKEYFKD